ncbi:MAG TPA: lysophospholipid acyltransferase family protein [Spirochaetota bacterium]|nr:lysophospholipid acyltransferase family protein [Spirochaetota bacterium]
MNNNLKGEVNPLVFLKTSLFLTLLILAVIVEIVSLPILIVIWIICKRNSVVFRKASRIIIGNGLYLLFSLDLRDFRKKLKQIKKSDNPRIYVINHSSIFDAILLFLIPDNIKILVKESYTKTPILGSIIKLNGHIVVKNSQNEEDGVEFYQNVVNQIKNGSVIAIFPEGTRSKDGNISRFKNGAFKIAYDTKSDIIPIVMDSWNIVRPSDGVWFRENKLYSKVLDTLHYENYKNMEPRDLAKTLRKNMATELFNIRESRKQIQPRYYRNKEIFKEIDGVAKNKLEKTYIE